MKKILVLFSFILLSSNFIIADNDSNEATILEKPIFNYDIDICKIPSRGFFAYSTVKQNIFVTNTYQDVIFNKFSTSCAWTIVDPTTIRCNVSGTYLIQYDALVQETAPAIKIPTTVSLHAIHNGSEILGSQSAISVVFLSKSKPESVTRAFMHKFKHGDTLKIQFAATRNTLQLVANNGLSTSQANITPSITLNIINVD